MTRRELREQIFKLLFGVEFHDRQELPEQIAVYEETEEPWDAKDGAYISGKCEDIVAHLAEIDEAIDAVAEGWKTGRMGKVDLTLIRLAVYEMKYDEDVPVGVAINEAVELAKKYGTDESPALSTVYLQSWYEKGHLFCLSNTYIQNMFAQDFMLHQISIKGEVSNCKYHSSGHIYFTLKDQTGTIAAVMFSRYRRGLAFQMKEGDKVVVTGSVEVYERDGKYQLYAREIELEGAGNLYLKFEALKRELEEMGMFDAAYKKPIPRYATRIGILTAPTGAAIQDIRNIAARRNPYAVDRPYIPRSCRGTAPQQALCAASMRWIKRVDVIIVGRGGGSIEDLWAFNEEEVARAIFACNTPVISAVGHQTDTTISDYVADLRAPTPSAAAELAVFDVQLVEKWLMDYGTQMRRQLELRLNQMRTRLMHDEEKLRYLNPRAKLKENEKRLDELGAALERRMQATLEQKRHTLALLSGRLDGMSPLKKLAQGYSYVEDAGGHALTDADTVQIGEALSIHLYRGSLKAAVTEIRKQDAAEDGLEKGRIDG